MHRTTWRGWLVASVLACPRAGRRRAGPGTEAASAALGGYPPLPRDAGTHRLLPLPGPGRSTSYTFLADAARAAAPVTLRPVPADPLRHPRRPTCRRTASQMIQQAVAEASAAPGLKFVDDGLTAEPLAARRPTCSRGTATAGRRC